MHRGGIVRSSEVAFIRPHTETRIRKDVWARFLGLVRERGI